MLKDEVLYRLNRFFRPDSLESKEWLMLRLVNSDRRLNRLKPLFMQNDLRLVARAHSNQMAEQDFFAHVDPQKRDPGDRIRGAGITDATFGENLAKMRGYENVTEEAENALMKSPGHRANILNGNFNCVGIGVIQAKDKTFYFTQNFARRFLQINIRKKYFKCEKDLFIRGNIIEHFEQLVLKEQYEKPFEYKYKVVNDKLELQIKFLERGRYELQVIVQPKNEKKYYVSNVLYLRSYKTIFDRFLI